MLCPILLLSSLSRQEYHWFHPTQKIHECLCHAPGTSIMFSAYTQSFRLSSSYTCSPVHPSHQSSDHSKRAVRVNFVILESNALIPLLYSGVILARLGRSAAIGRLKNREWNLHILSFTARVNFTHGTIVPDILLPGCLLVLWFLRTQLSRDLMYRDLGWSTCHKNNNSHQICFSGGQFTSYCSPIYVDLEFPKLPFSSNIGAYLLSCIKCSKCFFSLGSK